MAFSLRAGTHWCHDFPKLARESGFYFNIQRTPVRVDWNRLSTIDIDRLIRDRDFLTIDENVNNVVDYSLESTYDLKILDSNFVKIFRLAQLSIEYLLYCRQYLDQSVIILKDDLKSKLEENHKLKKDLTIAEETLKEFREKPREKYKLIEKKLSDSHGEIHKCPHCPKTFISSVFMSSHVTRRHAALSLPLASPMHEEYRAEAEKLHNEIKTLKERLNETERVIRSETGKFYESIESRDSKNHEHERYKEEINNLKSILFSEIRNLKKIERKPDFEEFEVKNFNELIKQQENEIQRLRDQLQKKLPDFTSFQVKLEAQEDFWREKLEKIEENHKKDMEKLFIQMRENSESAERIKNDYFKRICELEEKAKSRKLEENVSEEIKPEKKGKIEVKPKIIEISPKKMRFTPKNVQESKIEVLPTEKVKKTNFPENNRKIEDLRGNFMKKMEKSEEEEDFESEDVSESRTSQSQSESESTDEITRISEEEKVRTKEEIKAEVEENFNQRLRDLGVDPDWRGLPPSTYRQLSTIITHHRSLKSKKYQKFEEIRRKIVQQLSKKIPESSNFNKSPQKINKIIGNVKGKVRGLKSLRNPHNLLPEKLDIKFGELINSKKFINSRDLMNSEVISSSKNERYVSSPQKSVKNDFSIDVKGLSHSYESIKDFSKNSPNKLMNFGPISSSTPETKDKINEIVSAPSSPKSGRSVLKTVTGSTGNLGKKRVLFDLQSVDDDKNSVKSEESIAAEKIEDLSDSESSFSDKVTIKPNLPRETPVKFTQSEKIAEIARKIDLQLSAAREKPVGGIEAMFMRKSGEIQVEKAENSLKSGESSNFKEINPPKPKPRNSLNVPVFLGAKRDSKDSNLDLDIDELLRMD